MKAHETHNTELLNAVEKIRDHCDKTDFCGDCIFRRNGLNCILRDNPFKWDVNEITENMIGE